MRRVRALCPGLCSGRLAKASNLRGQTTAAQTRTRSPDKRGCCSGSLRARWTEARNKVLGPRADRRPHLTNPSSIASTTRLPSAAVPRLPVPFFPFFLSALSAVVVLLPSPLLFFLLSIHTVVTSLSLFLALTPRASSHSIFAHHRRRIVSPRSDRLALTHRTTLYRCLPRTPSGPLAASPPQATP